ncbi:hypothetical protein GCM10011383_13900 [Hymenobacter cavernae]|uniref:Uncharacterized protein n=1 Tax=Hymenobacter cavernae TaxID=2044852 RepID=A0ABQ1TXM8_9BACT|nr:hypothetical protein GCM10011383_13900 [Hymenobacter cavernae]
MGGVANGAEDTRADNGRNAEGRKVAHGEVSGQACVPVTIGIGGRVGLKLSNAFTAK